MNIYTSLFLAHLTIMSNTELTFDLKCSHRSHWVLRAMETCKRSDFYHCIYDINTKSFREQCLKPEDLPPGYHSVLSGQLHVEKCAENHFLPYISWSNGSFECQYQKHVCNEEGQIAVETGSNIEDVKCRCNYRRGYAYISKPKNKCLCSPLVEDCSCYLVYCGNRSLILSPDYNCMKNDSIPTRHTCPTIGNNVTSNSNDDMNGEINKSSSSDLLTFRSLFSIGVIFGFLIGAFVCWLTCFSSERETRHVDEWFSKSVKLLSMFPVLKNKIDRSSVLILIGREGTGKTTLAKCLHELYPKKRCKMIYIRKDLSNACYNIVDSHEVATSFENNIELYLNNIKRSKLIIIADDIPPNLHEFLKKIINEPAEIIFDLDRQEFYNPTDRKNILRLQMKKHNIYSEDDCEQLNSTDAAVPITIGNELFNDLLNEETLLGFPLMCDLLCSHKDHIQLGMKYFRQPPVPLVMKLDKLRKEGKSDRVSAIQYCLFVSVLLNADDETTFSNIIKNCLATTLQEIYPKKEISFDTKLVESIAFFLMPRYFLRSKSVFQFSNHATYQAVLISYGKIQPLKILDQCNICDIILFLRPTTYQPLHDEMVLSVEYSNSDFVTRVTGSVMWNDSIADDIIKHIASFTETYNESDLLLSIVTYIKSDTKYPHNSRLRFFRHCGVYATKFSKEFNDDLYAYCLAWEYVFVKMENEDHLSNVLETVLGCDSSVIGKVLQTPIDRFGNTLFHYFVIWNDKAEKAIINILLSKSRKGEMKNKDIANIWISSMLKNTAKLTPLHFAVFFGRYNFCENCRNMKNITRTQESIINYVWGTLTKRNEKEHLNCLYKAGFNNASDDVRNDELMKIMFETDLIPLKSDIKFGDKSEFDHINSILEGRSNMKGY